VTVAPQRPGRPLRGLLPSPRAVLLGLALAGVASVCAAPPAAAFTYGNLVVTRGGDVVEYRTGGLPVATIPVPYPPGARGESDPLGGIAFDSDARLAVFNGAAAPYLSVFDPAGPAWTHTSVPGWTTFSTAGFSGLGTVGHDVVVTDFGTFEGPQRGLIRFDGEAAYAPWRFADIFDLADVAIAPDGRVHALLAFSSLVTIWDPVTGLDAGSVSLEGSVQAIALREDGAYYGVSGDGFVRRFTPEGVSVDTLETGIPGLMDVAVGPGGDLVIGSALGEIVLCDAELTSARTVLVGTGATYVAWVPLHSTTPATPATWGRIKGRYRR
jgi:hypothetical protein